MRAALCHRNTINRNHFGSSAAFYQGLKSKVGLAGGGHALRETTDKGPYAHNCELTLMYLLHIHTWGWFLNTHSINASSLMMMRFICSCRNKKEPTAIYPSWVLPHPEKKRSTCDDAFTITLVVQWWFFVPFGIRGRVLYSLSGNHSQCPFIQMTDTDVTFLSCYNTVGHARVYVMALTSPPSLPLSRLWAELSVRRFMSSPLLIKDRHSSQFYLILSASSGSSKI
jgi:hypothetical protein